MVKTITQSELKQRVDYDAENGFLVWKKPTSNRAKAGERFGTLVKGYRFGAVSGVRAYEHQFIWLFVHGDWPSKEVDHRNGVKTDNRIDNLRLATKSQNLANISAHKDNSSGLKGVSAHRGKWQARIMRDGIKHNLGCYETKEAAHSAYIQAATEMFGEFARAA